MCAYNYIVQCTPVYCEPPLVFSRFQQVNTLTNTPKAASTATVAVNNMATTTATIVSRFDISPLRFSLGEADGDVALGPIPVMEVVVVAIMLVEVGWGSWVIGLAVTLETALLVVLVLGDVAGSEELWIIGEDPVLSVPQLATVKGRMAVYDRAEHCRL